MAGLMSRSGKERHDGRSLREVHGADWKAPKEHGADLPRGCKGEVSQSASETEAADLGGVVNPCETFPLRAAGILERR